MGDRMIIITATFVLADSSMRPDAVQKATPLQQATRDTEPGCEAYVFSPDPAEESKVAVYELWNCLLYTSPSPRD